jgi:hypothetical protein
MRLLLVVALGCVLTLTLGCSDDGGGPGKAGDGGGESAGQSSCPGCAAGQGCLEVQVTRVADESTMPWTLWPTEVDGVGTLVVGLKERNGGSGGQPERRTVSAADFTDPSAFYTVDFGCQPTLDFEARAFLDDDEDGGAEAISSIDYHDACPAIRYIKLSITAGDKLNAAFKLAGSCD